MANACFVRLGPLLFFCGAFFFKFNPFKPAIFVHSKVTIRSGAKERTFSKARLDVLILRLRSYPVLNHVHCCVHFLSLSLSLTDIGVGEFFPVASNHPGVCKMSGRDDPRYGHLVDVIRQSTMDKTA